MVSTRSADLGRGADPFIYLTGCNMSFRKSALRAVGGFNPLLAYGYDDVEVCNRIVDHGFRLALVDDAVVHHERVPSSVRDEHRVVSDPYTSVYSRAVFALQVPVSPHAPNDVRSMLDSWMHDWRNTAQHHVATIVACRPAGRMARHGRRTRRSDGGRDMAELSGMVAIVTGSSSGIGARTAQRLSELGASVVVNSSSSVAAGEAVAAALAGESSYVQADIADQEQCRHLLDATVERFGKLDLLVNNAGWTTLVDHRDLDALTDEIFRKTFEVNVFGTWNLTKMAMPLLRRSDSPGGGHVVNITSIAGVRPVGSSIAYSMSKAALNQMTRLLAKSHGPVRVNAVAPGLVETPWTSDWDAQHEGVKKVAPLKRSATPDDCAEAVLALVRNRYVTGEIFVVDGGLTQVS